MFLVTGSTNFVGRAVLKQLAAFDTPLRTLLEPSQASPALPPGVEVDVALSSLIDERGIRAAMVGVDTVIHLAGTSMNSTVDDPLYFDVESARILAQAAVEVGVKRFIYHSLLGADRSSAYPFLRARALAEDAICETGVPATILRTTMLFGADDGYTTSLALLMAALPLFFFMPGDGSIVLQPLWVEDLATCIAWAIDEPELAGTTHELGGPEYFSLREMLQMIMRKASILRILVPTRAPYLRASAWLLERLLPQSPVSTHWVDYFAVNRSTDLGTLPSAFGLSPSRMEEKLDYLEGKNWGWEFLRNQIRRSKG
jgi:NADH dehydrogenase